MQIRQNKDLSPDQILKAENLVILRAHISIRSARLKKKQENYIKGGLITKY